MAENLTTATPLPADFYRLADPVAVAAPRFVAINTPLARDLGLGDDFFDQPETLQSLAGNAPLLASRPVALAYSGHQFGGWNPLMGDGRAHLIATVKSPGGQLFELQLKGSGPTPFSKNGDGRATLGAMLREYVVSEAMAGLGISTTRSLAVVATGEQVYRRRKEPGGIVTRVAKSHVRVGSFQFAAAHLGPSGVQALLDHEIARSYGNPPADALPALWFLQSVITRQANLIAKWMCVGFIHGVMNTDNMSTSGETIDFGPCAFMDVFHPKKVFSSIDHQGRYAWDQQPAIGLWNLSRLAECLLPLIDADKDKAVDIARNALEQFYPQFEDAFESGMLAKLGIEQRRPGDGEFIAEILRTLMNEHADYTVFFRTLTRFAQGGDNGAFASQFSSPHAAHKWKEQWNSRLGGMLPNASLMASVNPVYIARNHQVEAALAEAEAGDMTRFDTLVGLLQHPFTEVRGASGFEAPPTSDEEVQQTFCNT